MTDAVTRLMGLADDYANTCFDQALNRQRHDERPEVARQALQDELVRLFTPLSDEQVERMSSVAPAGPDDWVHLSPWEYKGEIERARAAGIRIAEEAHGIKGRS